MERTFKVLNELERQGVIERYAIGGGIAATYYAEPVLTYDLDAFVLLPRGKGKLVTLSPIYDFLRRKGYRARGEYVQIEDLPVQFLPAYNDLVAEAVRAARRVRFRRTTVRFLRIEHLLAIAAQTGRAKDRARIAQLSAGGRINRTYLRGILERHGLTRKWQELEGQVR